MSLSFYAPFTPYIMRNKILEVFIMLKQIKNKIDEYWEGEETIVDSRVVTIACFALGYFGTGYFLNKAVIKGLQQENKALSKVCGDVAAEAMKLAQQVDNQETTIKYLLNEFK